jgi:hypothetical protein
MAKARLILTLVCAARAFAQAPDAPETDKDSAAIIELGGAASRNLSEGWSFGPSLAIEFTPIEHWLEIEAGVTPLFRNHSTEWDVDLLFKKPWELSKKVEFMIGVGPQWGHTKVRGPLSNSPANSTLNAWSGEVVLDFMFWPSAKHKFGWYVEPSYEYSFARGHERSVGITGGLLIAIR